MRPSAPRYDAGVQPGRAIDVNSPTDPDFSEDDTILSRLTDPEDVEAFSNLMENAHRAGKSAASFVREDPGRTSRRAILKLCAGKGERGGQKGFWAGLRSAWNLGRGSNGH